MTPGKAKFSEKLNCGIDVFHHDADVVHTPDVHDVSLVSNSHRAAAREQVAQKEFTHTPDCWRLAIGISGGAKLRPLHAIVRRGTSARAAGLVCYASSYADSSAATSNLTIFIIASITACTFFGFSSLMSSMKRLGTICQVTPN